MKNKLLFLIILYSFSIIQHKYLYSNNVIDEKKILTPSSLSPEYPELENIKALQINIIQSFNLESPTKNKSRPLIVKEIEKGVFIIQDSTLEVGPNNSAVIELSDKEILMIDTPYTPIGTEILMEWIRNKFPKHRITAINTHAHVDRTGGNCVLQKYGIPIYGSSQTHLEGHKHACGEREILIKLTKADPEVSSLFSHHKFVSPTHTFPLQEGLKLSIGGKIIEILYPGPGHTIDNCVVYLPDFKLLFGGCFLVCRPKILVTHETKLSEWPSSLNILSNWNLRLKYVIPGHPNLVKGGNEFSPETIEYTKKAVKKALES